MKKTLSSLIVLALGLQLSTAHDWIGARPDSHAPIGVMGEHVHKKNEFMLSYRYMHMAMDGMRDGSSKTTPTSVFANNYTVSPTKMSMDMHMWGLMYAPSDKLTLMAMFNYRTAEMDHTIFPGAAPLLALNGGNSEFTTTSRGFGDVKISGLYQFFNGGHHSSHFGLGVSLPTGSIGKQDIVPGPGGRIDRQLPAPMQLGSGTVDLLPSLTYLNQKDTWSWGAQMSGTIRTHENHHNYRLGHAFDSTAWIAKKVTPWLSIAPRARYGFSGELKGNQAGVSLNPPFAPTRRTVPTAFGENYGGHTIDLGASFNIFIPKGWLKGQRLAFEFMAPVYRNLNGLQLETDCTMTAGWQFAW